MQRIAAEGKLLRALYRRGDMHPACWPAAGEIRAARQTSRSSGTNAARALLTTAGGTPWQAGSRLWRKGGLGLRPTWEPIVRAWRTMRSLLSVTVGSDRSPATDPPRGRASGGVRCGSTVAGSDQLRSQQPSYGDGCSSLPPASDTRRPAQPRGHGRRAAGRRAPCRRSDDDRLRHAERHPHLR